MLNFRPERQRPSENSNVEDDEAIALSWVLSQPIKDPQKFVKDLHDRVATNEEIPKEQRKQILEEIFQRMPPKLFIEAEEQIKQCVKRVPSGKIMGKLYGFAKDNKFAHDYLIGIMKTDDQEVLKTRLEDAEELLALVGADQKFQKEQGGAVAKAMLEKNDNLKGVKPAVNFLMDRAKFIINDNILPQGASNFIPFFPIFSEAYYNKNPHLSVDHLRNRAKELDMNEATAHELTWLKNIGSKEARSTASAYLDLPIRILRMVLANKDGESLKSLIENYSNRLVPTLSYMLKNTDLELNENYSKERAEEDKKFLRQRAGLQENEVLNLAPYLKSEDPKEREAASGLLQFGFGFTLDEATTLRKFFEENAENPKINQSETFKLLEAKFKQDQENTSRFALN